MLQRQSHPLYLNLDIFFSSDLESMMNISYLHSIEAIRKSGGKLNQYAIPEMIEYLRRIGYRVSRCAVHKLPLLPLQLVLTIPYILDVPIA